MLRSVIAHLRLHIFSLKLYSNEMNPQYRLDALRSLGDDALLHGTMEEMLQRGRGGSHGWSWLMHGVLIPGTKYLVPGTSVRSKSN